MAIGDQGTLPQTEGNVSLKAAPKLVAPLVGAALLIALVVVLSFGAFRQVETSAAARQHSYNLIVGADALLSELRDAEIGQRGFALSGDETFLDPYLAAHDSISGHLLELRRLTVISAAQTSLEAVAPLVHAKLAQMSRVIELRRERNLPAVVAIVGSDQGTRLMDSIRAGINDFIRIEEGVRAQQEAEFQSSMRQLFALIIAASMFAFLFALSFAHLMYRETRHRLGDLLHAETRHLLEIQEETNKQLQQTNVTLHVSEQKLAVTLNSIGDAVIATDAQGRVTLLNPLAERLTGWTREEAFNRPVEEIFHIVNAQTRLPSTNPVQETLAHNTIRGLTHDTVLIARDGGECHIANSCAPIRDRGEQVVGAVLVFRNVTEHRRLDQALQDKNAELESARAVADKANLAKSDFLSSMSHELRTPLSAILGFAQLMECGTPLPTVSQKRSIDQILKAGWYLLDLINEILDLALIESGKLPLSLEPIALTEVMRECEAMIEPQAQKRGISVAFSRFDSPCFVKADRTRVKQVLINLLSNAIKYNKAGGTVGVDCIASTPGRIRICVRDTGAGLAPEKLAQLFQPFNRLGREATAEEGTGIGLVVCKRLIELMGGDIGVASTVGTGSEFWIELNVTAEPQLAAGAAALTAIAPMQAGAHVRTLL